VLLVDQQSHELGDRDRRVRVVELADVLVRETGEAIAVHALPAAEHVLEARGRQEVLLPQPQLLAALAGVVGIQHQRDLLAAFLAATAST